VGAAAEAVPVGGAVMRGRGEGHRAGHGEGLTGGQLAGGEQDEEDGDETEGRPVGHEPTTVSVSEGAVEKAGGGEEASGALL